MTNDTKVSNCPCLANQLFRVNRLIQGMDIQIPILFLSFTEPIQARVRWLWQGTEAAQSGETQSYRLISNEPNKN